MDNNKQYKVSILSSGDLNDKNTFEKYSETIFEFLTKNIPEHSEVTIGNIKNGTIIEFLKNNNIEVNVRRQHPNSAGSNNKRSMQESDITIFLHYNNSKSIKGFIEYIRGLKDKTYYLLELGCN